MMLTVAIAVLSAAARTPAARAYPAQPRPPTGFLDDFNGPAGSPPNPRYWTVPSWSISKNVYVDGQSHLVLKNTGPVSNYTESLVVSQDKVALGYGTFTASIKMPPGRGLWPAFWLLGENNDTVPWPSCGEIDVIELIGDGGYYCTIHGPITAESSDGQQQQFSGPLRFDPTADFHTYWCTHLEGAITFGIDSTTFGTMTPSTGPQDAAWPYNQPFYMILDLNTGDGKWCPKPDATTPFPAMMLVDWVKWEPAS